MVFPIYYIYRKLYIPIFVIRISVIPMKPSLLLLALLLLSHNAISGSSRQPDYSLYPPQNFTGSPVECNSWLSWQKPQMPGGGVPAGLVGYNLYRDGALLNYISSPDNLSYYDYSPEWGTYQYSITAYYDLTSYGLPGQFGESLPAPTVSVIINCDVAMPFREFWDQGTFTFQDWQFAPDQGNWTISTSLGNPAPVALFKGTPALQNYVITMKTTSLPGDVWVCANMFLDFDYKLDDIAATGTEKLTAGYYLDNVWTPVAEFSNTGSTGWIHQHIDITAVCTHRFRLGFQASGTNSAGIGQWYVDNIVIQPLCIPPTGLTVTSLGYGARLNWQPLTCDSIQALIGYNIYRTDSTGNAPYYKINTMPLIATEYTDIYPPTQLSGNFRYYVTDLQKDLGSGMMLCEASSDTVLFDFLTGTGTIQASGVSLCPVPASDYLGISWNGNANALRIRDVVGRTIGDYRVEGRQRFEAPVDQLPSGIYIACLETATGVIYRKFVVSH